MKISAYYAAAVLLAFNPSGEVSAAPPGTSAAELGLEQLADEPSRGDLFAQMRKDDAKNDPDRSLKAQTFALTMRFRFPPDVTTDYSTGKPRANSIFGIDISHHQDSFPVSALRAKGARFIFIKASQGTGFVDGRFADYWAQAGALPKAQRLHRGAYHFLSAGAPGSDAAEWGRKQAVTFLKVLKANMPPGTSYASTDMPPAMDLEWDKANATAPDRWQGRSPDQILTMAKAFLEAVEAGIGRKPLIYTAQSWWHERIGQDSRLADLAGYPLWLADYTQKSRIPELPRTINGAPWALWQFTESAQMPIGYGRGFDANIFKGGEADFYKTFGVKAFAE